MNGFYAGILCTLPVIAGFVAGIGSVFIDTRLCGRNTRHLSVALLWATTMQTAFMAPVGAVMLLLASTGPGSLLSSWALVVSALIVGTMVWLALAGFIYERLRPIAHAYLEPLGRADQLMPQRLGEREWA